MNSVQDNGLAGGLVSSGNFSLGTGLAGNGNADSWAATGAIASSNANRHTPALTPPTLALYQGREYRLTEAKTWEEAQAEAFALGGHLVTINDAAEDAWLRQTFGQQDPLWIGLSDRDCEGNFTWANGEAVTYTNWINSQPDNYNPDLGGEDAVVLSFGQHPQWNDVGSNERYRGIIELDAPVTLLGYEEEFEDPSPSRDLRRIWGEENFSVESTVPPAAVPSPVVVETDTPDPGVSDSGVLEPEVAETGVPELGVPELGVPELGVPEPEVVEAIAPESTTVFRISMPADSASPAVAQETGRPWGGGEFLDPLNAAPADRLRLSYQLRFSDNFDFVKGGKLPGLYGGTAPSGGSIPNGSDGFSTRFMWREQGAGEVYAYLPSSQTYGTSLGRGGWSFTPGVWHTLEQELVLNDPDQANGQLRVWLDNQLVISENALQFRTTDQLKIDGVYVSAFFGGGTADYVTPEDVYIDFDAFRIWQP